MLLTNPYGVVDDRVFGELQEKISLINMRLMAKPENGGNPFLFIFTADKPQILAYEFPKNGMKIPTAGTNGKEIYWNPDYLLSLTISEAVIVKTHEMNHVMLFHPQRGVGKHQKSWRVAIDYLSNAIIWVDHKKLNKKGSLWGGNIGDPLLLIDYITYIDGNKLTLPEGTYIYADPKAYSRTAESIYEEIYDHWMKSPRRCYKCDNLTLNPITKAPFKPPPFPPNACPVCGTKSDDDNDPGGLDAHTSSDVNDSDVISDLKHAEQQVESMHGVVPRAVGEKIKKLTDPVVDFLDLVRAACLMRAKRSGLINNWKRPRRRSHAIGMYLPERHGYIPTWLCLIDTSMSMKAEDIAFGISQLQTLCTETKGYVIPCDSAVYWDKMTEINNAQDLQSVQVVGRGGTVFNDFFAGFRDRINIKPDIIIVITDGYLIPPPATLTPKQDVIWGITSYHSTFKPNFGRVAPLRK
jgi:predicted metal-dependent peptidase